VKSIIIVNIIPGFIDTLVKKVQSRGDFSNYFIANNKIEKISSSVSYEMFDINDFHYHLCTPNRRYRYPLDQSILHQMSRYEYMALRCFDKLEKISIFEQSLRRDKFLNGYTPLVFSNLISTLDRKLFYLEQLSFWNNLILENNVKNVLFTNVPHFGFDYIIYGLCKIYSINCLFFQDIDFINRTIGRSDIFSDYHLILDQYQNIKKSNIHLSIDMLSLASKDFYLKQTNTADPVPYYMLKKDYGFPNYYAYDQTSLAIKSFLKRIL
jgi:hypothetical protein